MSDQKKNERQSTVVSVAVTTLLAAPVLGCSSTQPVADPPPAQAVSAENRAAEPVQTASAKKPADPPPAKSTPEDDKGPVHNPKGVRG